MRGRIKREEKATDKKNQLESSKMNGTGKKKKKDFFSSLSFGLMLIVVVLSLVIITRLAQDNPVFPNGESYYNLRIAESLNQDFSLKQDPVQEKLYEANPYHYLLAVLLIIIPVELLSIYLPLLFGILCGFIFYKLMIRIGVKPKSAAYSLIVLSVTPAFIVLFTGLYVLGFSILLSLLTLLLALQKKKSPQPLCIFFCTLVFILLALTSLIGFLLTIIMLLLLSLVLKKRIKSLFIPIGIPVLLGILLTFFTSYVPQVLGFHKFAFQNILSLLKAAVGFDLFLIVLFITGFIVVWVNNNDNKDYRLYHLAVLILFVFSFFNIVLRAYVSFIITFYIIVAITFFFNRKWDSEIIKKGTLLLVLCSLVFSLINQASILVDAEPDKEMQQALVFFNGLSKGKTFALEQDGFLIEFYSNKNVLLDSNSRLASDYKDIKNDSSNLLTLVRLKEAESILDMYNIRYILLTPYMKEELWENQRQGLWFLVRNSDTFIKKYAEEEIEIWEYAPVEEDAGALEDTLNKTREAIP